MSAERAAAPQKKEIFKIVSVILLVVVLALIIAWGATRYYGERRNGQEVLLPDESDILAYTAFHWGMDDPAEVEFDTERIRRAQFKYSSFRFIATDDTYFYPKLGGQKLLANTHFLFLITGKAWKRGGWLNLTLSQTRGNVTRRYISDRIDFPMAEPIDLHGIPFFPESGESRELYWGREFTWANGLRIDISGLGKTWVEIDLISFLPGVTLDFDIGDLLELGEIQGLKYIPKGRGLRLPREEDTGWFVTPPIGLGTIESFYDIKLSAGESPVKTEMAVGEIGENDADIKWSDWEIIWSDRDINRVEPKQYVRFKFSLAKADRLKGHPPYMEGFRLRYIDSSPPGLGGPLFGTVQLPVYRPDRSLSEFGIYRSQSAWVRIEYSSSAFGIARFDKALNMLLAHNYNVIVSLDLADVRPTWAYELVRRYHDRVHVWEVLSHQRRGATFFTEVFRQIRQLDPGALIFPEPVTSDYLQQLAMNGLYHFASTSGTQEEVLDRGFLWFFVLAVLGLFIVVALGPVVGYHFKLTLKELKWGGAGLVICVILLIPFMELSGLARLTAPRDWAQIEIAFNRYLVSAFLQEFARALLMLLPVIYLVRGGLRDKTAWLLVLVCSSIFFGMGHVGYPGLTTTEILGFVVVTTVAGLVFGAVFWATRSLTVVVIIHLLANVFLSTMTTIGPQL